MMRRSAQLVVGASFGVCVSQLWGEKPLPEQQPSTSSSYCWVPLSQNPKMCGASHVEFRIALPATVEEFKVRL
jgi:hypothetical protein